MTPPPEQVLAQPGAVPRGARRAGIRAKPGFGHAYRLAVFLAGLLFIVLGVVLAILPGPLTIPPVLLGLWIWSTEFAFAERLLDSFKRRARVAWAHARRHPRSSAIVTASGMAAAGVAIWAISRYGLIDRTQQAVGF